jgi:hypothetical protein
MHRAQPTTDVGDTLSLFAAGVALFILLIASYTGRSAWIALGSTALSVAMFIGLLFFATVHEPGQVQSRLAWVADRLSLVAAPKLADELKSAVAAIAPSCGAGEGSGCPATAEAPPPEAAPPPKQAAVAPSWFGTSPDSAPTPQATSQSPVAWTFDQSGAQPPVTSPWGFSISGTNVSDQALEDVHAVLKPDSGARAVDLMLDIEGLTPGDRAVIPAGGRFSLVSASPDENDATLGGAILSFRYLQAGQRKTSILYLSPAMIARFANR